MPEEPIVLDMAEMAEYIQRRLMEKGYAITDEAVALVLEAEEAFMVEKGVIVYDEELPDEE